MASRLSSAATASLSGEQRPEDLPLLVTITDPALEEPLRYTNCHLEMIDTETAAYGVVSAGDTFRALVVSGVLPDDSEDMRKETEIVLDALDPTVRPELRQLTSAAKVDLALCLSNDPDTRFMMISGLEILDRSYDLETATLTIGRYANGARSVAVDEPLVAQRQTRQNAPGLHQ